MNNRMKPGQCSGFFVTFLMQCTYNLIQTTNTYYNGTVEYQVFQ